MARQARASKAKSPPDRLLPKFTLLFFDRPLFTALLWLVLTIFGIMSYTTLLKREGFPSVNIPLGIVTGPYFVNDPAKVDADIAKPVSDAALAQPEVKTIQTQSNDNFFMANIQFEEGTDAKAASDKLKASLGQSGKIPNQAKLQYSVPYFGATGGDSEQIDIAVSFFGGNSDTQKLTEKANEAARWLGDKKISGVKSVGVKSPFQQVVSPATGQTVTVQRSFDRFGSREGNEIKFYNSIIIAFAAEKGTDVIKLQDAVKHALQELKSQPQFSEFNAEISASFAPAIQENLSELQKVLIEGLLAILVVGSLVIAIRASVITVVSMITVLLSTLGLLYIIGYTLNVITLFALILGLALIVDDTIIMVEAIDSARKQQKNRREIVRTATTKISRAMVAATLTAALSFAPLIFVGGILGSFIRAIPITLIAALIISLLVALVFIPFFSRFLLLGPKQLGKQGVKEVASGFESALAHFITRPMKWARHSRARLGAVIIAAVLLGLGFVFAGLVIARGVVFNIFPPSKDTNGVALSMQFPEGTTIEKAEEIGKQADELAAKVVGDNFVQSSYFASGSAQSALVQIELTPYGKRDIASPEIVKQLQERFDKDFDLAQVAVGQLDLGPPSSAFVVQVDASNRSAAFKLANEVADFLGTTQLKRPDGSIAHLANPVVSSSDQYSRNRGRPIVTVSAGFDGTDTTTLVTLAQNAVKAKFNPAYLGAEGLSSNALSFDLGQESENQESFKTLALAFPVLLVVMFVLLAMQFRSLLQPLLIFMAIPFSIFGVMLGLDLTNNAISFFSMLGFFALVGLSIKNTILLTDYANQARRQGMTPIDAAAAALEERFRPLFATSTTAVVSLIPLAITSPFWEGLAVVLIFGLLSSTLLVVVVFPYYYLAAEYARIKITAKSFLLWVVLTGFCTVAATRAFNSRLAWLVIPMSLYLVLLQSYFEKRLRKD